ncbi:hypothetical protein RHOSPDRAFT_36828 [Rhodotorula sp. JG-1b]|nr:hypothetical protein RHOSPDRAFT_36828 [Rhodotorula sp. JG-1b]
MAATYAKGLPQAVSAFAHAADRLTPEQQQQQQHDFAALSSNFRADASSSSSSASEFSRFAQQHAGPSSALPGTGFGQQAAAAWERSQTGRSMPSAIPAQSPFAASQDGHALVALLNGHDSVVDAVDGDWERQLAQEQQQHHSSAVGSPLPADPLASKPVPQLLDTARRATPGDMSPTSESLLASVSNLSLAEQTYLRTLLASQDPAAMFQDYFSHATYTDDVWTPIASGPLREVLDRAAAADTGKGKGKERVVDDEEGKAKAVRRLEMVLRQLNGHMGSTTVGAPLATNETRAGRLGGGSSGGSVENHHHHPNLADPSTAADSRASDAPAHALYSTTAVSTSFAALSSLSSSAFVSFSPPSVAVHSPTTLQYYPHRHHTVAASSSSPSAVEHIDDAQRPSVATPHDHHRPATQPRTNSYAASSSSGESNGTDASYEEYAKEKEARMRSNEGGRFGPDFSSMRSVFSGREERADVTEGRTH